MRLFKCSLLLLFLVATTIWALLAVYFGDSHGSIGQTCVAAVFGLFGLVTLAGLGFAPWRKPFWKKAKVKIPGNVRCGDNHLPVLKPI